MQITPLATTVSNKWLDLYRFGSYDEINVQTNTNLEHLNKSYYIEWD